MFIRLIETQRLGNMVHRSNFITYPLFFLHFNLKRFPFKLCTIFILDWKTVWSLVKQAHYDQVSSAHYLNFILTNLEFVARLPWIPTNPLRCFPSGWRLDIFKI